MAETLQLIITADNKEALKAIEDLAKSTEGLKYKFQDVKKGTSEATNAMINFSRLAEDSAYGIRGAANNINPFIESFGRLKEKAKDSGTTIAQELLPTLIGPAGLAVAVSLVSALYIKWSDYQNKAKKEAEELAKANGKGVDEIKKQKDAIDSVFSSVAKESTEVSTLIAVLNNENETRKRKTDALEKLKKLNPEIFGDLKIEEGIVNGLNTAYNKYIDNLENIIFIRVKQLELEKITTDILKRKGVLDTEEEKQIKKTGSALKIKQDSLKGENEQRRDNLNVQIKNNAEEIKTNDLYKQRDSILKAISERTQGIKITNEVSNTDKLTKSYENLNKELTLELEISKKLKENAKQILGKQQIIPMYSDVEASVTGKKKPDMKSEYERILKGDNTLGLFLDKLTKDLMPDIDIEKLLFKESVDGWKKSKEAAKDFANTMANDITGALRSTWDAIQSGKSIFDAISESLMKFIEELGFAIIKAQILADIQNSIKTSSTGVTGADAGGSGFFDLLFTLMKVVPFANGGIVNKPTFSMIGEAGPEAVMPLSKLSGMMSSTFNAGAMSGQSTGGNGQFVLRGQDLLVAINRTQKSSFLKGQNISLV